jgi:hypothetical protein
VLLTCNLLSSIFLKFPNSSQGLYKWPSGAVYDGEFVNGQREGRGKYTYSGGGKYKGAWKACRRNGFGYVTPVVTSWNGPVMFLSVIGENVLVWSGRIGSTGFWDLLCHATYLLARSLNLSISLYLDCLVLTNRQTVEGTRENGVWTRNMDWALNTTQIERSGTRVNGSMAHQLYMRCVDKPCMILTVSMAFTPVSCYLQRVCHMELDTSCTQMEKFMKEIGTYFRSVVCVIVELVPTRRLS